MEKQKKKPTKAAAPTAKKTTARTTKKAVAKSQVRNSRSTVRAEKQKAAKKTENTLSRMKEKHVGHAPQSTRITATKGAVQSIASRTKFVPKDYAHRNWLLIDAQGQRVGRLASQIASLLRGKHKAEFTPNNDGGDFVIVINAAKVIFTRNKEETKGYYKHTGYVGGLKISTPARLREKNQPERILEAAVKGMITRSPLGRDMMRKLKVYEGAEHPHAAQNPVLWKLRYDASITA